MPKPKFTDEHRYPRGYTHATDVAATFKRIRKQLAEEENKRKEIQAQIQAEQVSKVRAIGRKP
jgi:hypothetical protein